MGGSVANAREVGELLSLDMREVVKLDDVVGVAVAADLRDGDDAAEMRLIGAFDEESIANANLAEFGVHRRMVSHP